MAGDTEKGGLLLQLLHLSQTPEQLKPRGALARLMARPLRRARRTRHAENQRTAERAQKLVLARWNDLPPEARRVALAIEHAPWHDHLLELLSTEALPIDAAVAFLTDEDARGEPRPFDPRVIRVLLASGDRHGAELAERTVLPEILAGVRTPNDQRPAALRATRPDGSVANAAAAALAALEHAETAPRPIVSLAALLLLDRPARDPDRAALAALAAAQHDPDHPAFAPLRRALKRDRSPATRRLAWRLLRPGPLAIASLERIGAAESPAEHDALLADAHLLANPARAAALAGGGRVTRTRAGRRRDPVAALCPPPGVRLSAPAERGLARLRAHAGEQTAATMHDRLLASPDERARLTAARHAEGQHLTDFCLDEHPAVAEAAALRRSSLGIARAADRPAEHRVRTSEMLARSPHPAVRRVALDDLGTADLLAPDGAPTVRAWALARTDPDRLARELGDRLDRATPADAVRTLLGVTRLGVSGPLADRIASLVGGADDPRLAATASAALGSVPGRAALAPLDTALRHADPRVRANAVESLERVSRSADTDPGDRLVELKASPEHRARANALRALERLRLADDGEIHDDTSRMLFDARPHHRLAAVWLAERLLCDPRSALGPRDEAWQVVARCVAALARTEDDAHIHARATRCARRLLAEVRRPAPDPALARTARRLRAVSPPDLRSPPSGVPA